MATSGHALRLLVLLALPVVAAAAGPVLRVSLLVLRGERGQSGGQLAPARRG